MEKRTVKTVLSTMALALILMSAANYAPVEAKIETRTVIDMAGREVELPLPENIKRLVVFCVPFHGMIYAVDGTGERMIGINPSSMRHVNTSILGNMAPELKNASTSFIMEGTTFIPNVEEVMKLNPDVVIQWKAWGEYKSMVAVGLPVTLVTYGGQDDLEGALRMLGEILGKEEQAEKIIRKQHDIMAELAVKVATSKISDPRIYLCSMPLKGSTGGYTNVLMGVSGGANVAKGWEKTVTMEQVVAWNPEIIYINNFAPDDLLPEKFFDCEQSGIVGGALWKEIDAVKNRRVYRIPMGVYRWSPPSTESGLVMKWLAHIQHPDTCDYLMADVVKDYYSELYNYELSDEEVNWILGAKHNPYPTGF